RWVAHVHVAVGLRERAAIPRALVVLEDQLLVQRGERRGRTVDRHPTCILRDGWTVRQGRRRRTVTHYRVLRRRRAACSSSARRSSGAGPRTPPPTERQPPCAPAPGPPGSRRESARAERAPSAGYAG